MRAEFAAIAAGMDKLPTMTGNGSKIVAVNSGGSGLEAITTTGTGSGVRATSPTLVTPVLGVASATSINKLAITAPATGATLTVADGKTATFSNTITIAGTDGSTLNVSTGGTLGTAAFTAATAYLGATANINIGTTAVAVNRASASQTLTGVSIDGNAATVTTNANLAGPITSSGNTTAVASQTGTGTKFVMDSSPTLVTPNIGVATATSVNKVTITAPAAGSTLTIANGKTLTANASIALSGTDSTTMTFPGTSATIARTDAGQTFTGTQVFGAIDVNGGAVDGTPIGAASRSTGDFTRVVEDVETLTPALNAAVTVDWSKGASAITVNGTHTLTFSNVGTGVSAHVVYATNFNSITWPAAVSWGVGGKPSIAGIAFTSLVSFDGGATVAAAVYWQAV